MRATIDRELLTKTRDLAGEEKVHPQNPSNHQGEKITLRGPAVEFKQFKWITSPPVYKKDIITLP
jgi:hypothetical protein